MEPLKELAKALAAAQAKLQPAAKDTDNPFFKSKYADLSSVWAECRKVLPAHGLSVVQLPDSDESGMSLRTVLLHESGESIESRVALVGELKTMQQYGSALTYARRYGLASIVGVVADEDDDGNAASVRPSKPSARKPDAPSDENPKIGVIRGIYSALNKIGAIKAGIPDDEKRAVAHRYAAWALKRDVKSLNELSPMELSEAASKIGALTAPVNVN